jgi:hypothetical protein
LISPLAWITIEITCPYEAESPEFVEGAESPEFVEGAESPEFVEGRQRNRGHVD